MNKSGEETKQQTENKKKTDEKDNDIRTVVRIMAKKIITT